MLLFRWHDDIQDFKLDNILLDEKIYIYFELD